ncbi:MAG: hypothetical protein WA708_00930 [Acidobacteriaceae bacterium]
MRIRLNNITSAVLVFSLLVFCLCRADAAQSTVAVPAPDLGRFPTIQATSLEKTHMNLPQDFAGQLDFVVISFAREQQKEVDTWIPVARQIQSAHSNFAYYELFTMSRENFLSRWWFDAALRSDTSDKDMRKRILTAYLNKHKFQQSLHISSEKEIVAILVDKAGKIYWRGDGAASDASRLSLRSALAANGMSVKI